MHNEYGIDPENSKYCFLGSKIHTIGGRKYHIIQPIVDEDPVFGRRKMYFVLALNPEKKSPETFALESIVIQGEIPKLEDKRIIIAFGNPTAKQKLDLSMILKM